MSPLTPIHLRPLASALERLLAPTTRNCKRRDVETVLAGAHDTVNVAAIAHGCDLDTRIDAQARALGVTIATALESADARTRGEQAAILMLQVIEILSAPSPRAASRKTGE